MDEVQNAAFHRFVPSTEDWGRSELKILSVGSGEGEVDRDWIAHLEKKGFAIRKYVAVEPLENHIAPLRAHLESELPADVIEIRQQRIEDLALDEKFDLIHAVHVVHWLQQPERVLADLSRSCSAGGKMIVILQSDRGVPRLYDRFRDVKSRRDGTLTAEVLCEQLRDVNLRFSCDYVPAELDVTEIVAGNETGKDLLRFLMSNDLSSVDARRFRDMCSYVESIAVRRGDRFILEEPFAFIVITRD